MAESSVQITKKHIQALRAGDQNVLHWIFTTLQPRIYRFFYFKLNSVEIAEDLVQETFLRLWEARTRLKTDTNLETYIFRIATNLATDQLRRMERNMEVQTEKELAAPGLDSGGDAELAQLQKIISKIVLSLPDGSRTAFILSRQENLSHKQIAEIMDISVKTVEKHIGRALQILKERLEKFDIVLPS